MLNEQLLTIVMVEYQNEKLVELNMRLILELNPELAQRIRFIVVNNSNSPSLHSLLASFPVDILPGVERVLHGDRGSYHHAAALQLAVNHVQTPFLLIMDPDFFVLPQRWLSLLLEQCTRKDLHCIASTWHPRAALQPKYNPTIHMMLLDRQKLPLNQLPLRPDIEQHFEYNKTINAKRFLPPFIKKRLIQSTLRDTAYLVSNWLREHGRFELLSPVFEPARHFAKATRLLDRLVPERLSYTPQNPSSYCRKSFLKEMDQDLYSSLCEEFYWHDKPFAIHLRQVGRHWENELEKQNEIERMEETVFMVVAAINRMYYPSTDLATSERTFASTATRR